MFLNLPEVRLRIENGLNRLEDLRGRRDNIISQIVFWKSELRRLKDRESELELEALDDDPDTE